MKQDSAKSPPLQLQPTADVKRAVLDAALSIISSEGPDAVSMREVARRAGVSHQAPYHYFGDRAGIFAAIAEEGFLKFADVLRASLDSDDPLVNCLNAYVMFAIEHQGHYRVMFRKDICGVSTHETTTLAADNAFLVLLDLAATVHSEDFDSANSLVLPTAIWAHAHGLATLLIDSPLLAKLPPELDLSSFIRQVGQFASRSFNGQVNR